MAARRRKGRKTARPAKPTARKRAQRPKKASPRARAKPSRRKARPTRSARSPAPPKPSPSDRRLVAGAALEVGVVLHYYPRAGAAVVALSRPIHRGDQIHVRGQTTDFVQAVTSLALDGSAVAAAVPSQEVGVQLEQRARAGDRVFRVSW